MMQDHTFHPGEQSAHQLAGVVEQAELSRGAIGASLPPPAVAFLVEQSMLVVGAADDAGRMWASPLTGNPGFARSLSPSTVQIRSRPKPVDPLAAVLARPTLVGLLALEPATRRRMRINGRSEPEDSGLMIAADQVYANCPKYIQKRSAQLSVGATAPTAGTTTTSLSRPQQEWIRNADTFFVATRSGGGDCDVSHRGGNPGFVEIVSETELIWPDYVGNAMFMTLGNLQQEPAAGLLFLDYETGNTLQLTGTASVDWEAAGRLPGAERVVEFRLRQVVQIDHGTPFLWSRPERSKYNPALPGFAGDPG